MRNEKNKFPRGVEVVVGTIIRKGAKILMTRSPKWNHKWVCQGGHIEEGETIAEAGIREGEEETGLKLKFVSIVKVDELINSKDFHRPAHFIFIDCVLDVIGGELKLQEDELDEAKWCTPQEVLNLDLAESYKESIEKYIEYLKYGKNFR